MNESNMWKETDEEILQQIPEKLLTWYDKNARVLPWREDPRPYRVWVSEIMLQQTRVEAVKPYFERFLKALPTVEDLAQAPEEQLLKLWEGLGYYNRVRNLQRGARAVMAEHGGVIPASFEALKKLPGIGDYTAGAIGSIAFQIPVPAVDGNVLRVISRVLYRRDNILDEKVKRRIEGEIKEILPESEIVILSGYRDFSYAQTAMQIGVSDYLLKPIKKTDFGDMLHRMYERLEAKIGQAAYYQVLDGYARGLVGEEEVKHAVSSVQPANVAQRPGVLAKEGEQSPTKIVRDALYYIRRHYNENISLTDVAEHINVNKSYLCDVFKKEQKVTILQYMTNLRIEKAKELLLHTDMKMYEISVEVGYNDYTYFSQIFKRNTGETLSEFRKKAGSKK